MDYTAYDKRVRKARKKLADQTHPLSAEGRKASWCASREADMRRTADELRNAPLESLLQDWSHKDLEALRSKGQFTNFRPPVVLHNGRSLAAYGSAEVAKILKEKFGGKPTRQLKNGIPALEGGWSTIVKGEDACKRAIAELEKRDHPPTCIHLDDWKPEVAKPKKTEKQPATKWGSRGDRFEWAAQQDVDTPSERAVLKEIAVGVDTTKGWCSYSQERIAKRTMFRRETVSRALAALERKRLIRVLRRPRPETNRLIPSMHLSAVEAV